MRFITTCRRSDDVDARDDFGDALDPTAGSSMRFPCRCRAGIRRGWRRPHRRRPGRCSRRRYTPRCAVGGKSSAVGDFHDLLMPPLHRAITFLQAHQVAVLVAQQLHFNVPGCGGPTSPGRYRGCRNRHRFARGLLQLRRQGRRPCAPSRMPRPPPWPP